MSAAIRECCVRLALAGSTTADISRCVNLPESEVIAATVGVYN